LIETYESEESLCDGQDNDCDGAVDETYSELLSSNQNGVCADLVKVCEQGQYVEPDLSLVEGYEIEESTCDGIDSDCDGEVDEELMVPLSAVQTGVCANALKVCGGQDSLYGIVRTRRPPILKEPTRGDWAILV
jgi:hypothetical protein